MFSQLKLKKRNLIPPAMIGATAQLALVFTIALSQLEVQNTDFIQGILAGYSIVGNLFFIAHVSRQKEEK
jgi:hypothetical protein